MIGPQRWIILSDCHLARDSNPDPRPTSQALVHFIRSHGVLDETSTTFILLGDFFELLNDASDPLLALDAILVGQAEVIAALDEAVSLGTRIVVVPGNHDAALAIPAVWRRLREAFVDPEAVELSPWIFHVPGVLYAEHGHQHHDLNRMPRLLTTVSDGLPPLVTPLAAGSRRQAVGAAASSWRSERRSKRHAYGRLLGEHAAELHLSEEVVRSLHRLSAFHPIRSAGRVFGVRVGRKGCANSAMARRKAAAIAEILRRSEYGVAAVVFGHTHRAEQLAVTEITSYLNSGTWTADVRGFGPDVVDSRLFPYVEVTLANGLVAADVRYFTSTAEEVDSGGVQTMSRSD